MLDENDLGVRVISAFSGLVIAGLMALWVARDARRRRLQSLAQVVTSVPFAMTRLFLAAIFFISTITGAAGVQVRGQWQSAFPLVFIGILVWDTMMQLRRRRTRAPGQGNPVMTPPEGEPLGDAGWDRVLGPLLWNLVPVYGQWKLLREKPDQADGLTALRFIFIGLVVSLFLFLVVLSFIVPWNGSGDAKWLLPAIAVVAAIGLACVRAARNRPLKIESRERLAGSYRANLFLGVGYSEAPAAFFGAVFVGKLWLYLVGLASALVGLALIAPTRADIERRQQQIAAQGSSLSLLEALMSPPSQDSGGDPS